MSERKAPRRGEKASGGAAGEKHQRTVAGCRTPGWDCCGITDQTGLFMQATAVLADTYKGPWVYMPRVRCSPIWPRRWPTGADCIDGVGQLW